MNTKVKISSEIFSNTSRFSLAANFGKFCEKMGEKIQFYSGLIHVTLFPDN